MNTEIDLVSLIKLSLNVSAHAPALDPYIIDWQHRGCSPELAEVVYGCLNNIRGKLFRAGFYHYEQGIVSSHNIIQGLENYLHFKSLKLKPIRSVNAGNNIYVLTKKADGRLFIHPPFDENDEIISWDKYYLRIEKGERLPLMIVAPWAQAKIMDILENER